MTTMVSELEERILEITWGSQTVRHDLATEQQQHIYPFPSFLFSTTWNKNVMAGAASATLDHETLVEQRDRRSLCP